QAEDGIRDRTVTGVQTCALPISDRLHLVAALCAGHVGLSTGNARSGFLSQTNGPLGPRPRFESGRNRIGRGVPPAGRGRLRTRRPIGLRPGRKDGTWFVVFSSQDLSAPLATT